MAAPQPPPRFAPDLPAIELLERSMPRLVAVPPARAPRADRAARIGLVLSVVLALVGVVCAVGRSGDETTATAGRPASATHGSDSTTTTTTTTTITRATAAPAGFRVVTGPGIALAVPDDWTTMDPADLHLSTAQLRGLYPDMDPDLLQAAKLAVDNGAIFMAVDMAGEGQGHSVNVLKVPAQLPMDQMDDVVAGLESSGIDVKETHPIDHPLGRAFRVTYGLKVAGQVVDGVQFWIPVDDATYVITVTAEPTDVVEKIAQSFRVDHSISA